MYSITSLICKDQLIYRDLSCFQSIHIPSFDSFHIQMIHIKIENTCIGNTFANIIIWISIHNMSDITLQIVIQSMKSYTSFSSINRISPHLENSFIQQYTLYPILLQSILHFHSYEFHMMSIYIDSNISLEYDIWGSIIEWIGSIPNDFYMVCQKCSNESRNITSNT